MHHMKSIVRFSTEHRPQCWEHLSSLSVPPALRCAIRNPVPNGTAPSYKIRTWGYVPLDAAGHFRTLEVNYTTSSTTLCALLGWRSWSA